MIELDNHWYHFSCLPERGRFMLSMDGGAPYNVLEAAMQTVYRKGLLTHQGLIGAWRVESCVHRRVAGTPQGELDLLELRMQPDESGMVYQVDFALCQEHPLFLWRVRASNQGHQAVHWDRFELLCTEHVSLDGQEEGPEPQRAFFANGWQSWSYSGSYAGNQPGPRSWLALIEAPMWLNAAALGPYQAGHYRSDFFGVIGDRANRKALLAGFLSQREQFGQLEARLGDQSHLCLWAAGDNARLDPGQSLQTDWAVLYAFDLDQLDPLGPYLEAVQREYTVQVTHLAPAGWCSWYKFYDKVTAAQIEDNLRMIVQMKARLPLDLVQIDDGFQAQVGDWFDFRPTFPQGVAGLAQQIKAQGLTPGLWLAPFIVHPRSRLAKEHPEFLLRDVWGQPVYTGFNWGGFNRALDLTQAGALEYACKVVETATHEWGYPYLKLDFLYAAAVPGAPKDGSKTRAQILRMGLEALRKAAGPETLMLGCGVPLGSAIGLFEYMRIGTDTAWSWNPVVFGLRRLVRQEPHVPSARNAVQNPLTRSGMHQRWWLNDPDCLLVRPDSELTLAEIQSCASVMALTGGSLLLSDDLPAVPPERLRIAEALLPLIDRRAAVIDWFDRTTPEMVRVDLEGATGGWTLVARFNWRDRPSDMCLRLADYYFLETDEYLVRSFWDGQVYRSRGQDELVFPQVAAHGVVLLAVRRLEVERLQYAGSDLHISQGMEVIEWQVDPAQVHLRLALPRLFSGIIDLAVPRTVKEVWVDERPGEWHVLAEGICRVSIPERREVRIRLLLETT